MDRLLCALRVASDLPLPELLPWTGEARPADLTIRLGDVPQIADPVQETPLLQIGADGTCRFEVAAVAAYRVDPAGREIVVAPKMDMAAADIRVFLFGTVFAIVCFRRGLWPLHASVVRIGDKAVAFSGKSGAGKSTLAACFAKRGYGVVADDVAVIDMPSGQARVWPMIARLKLWRDMMEALALSKDGLERARCTLEKYHLPLDDFSMAPLALTTVYHLGEAKDPRFEEMRALSGVDHFLAMKQAVYRGPLGHRLLGAPAMLARTGQVTGAVRSVRLCRLLTLERANEIVDEVVSYEGTA